MENEKPVPAERYVWDQIPGETNKQYSYFVFFKNLPTHDRTCRRVAEEYDVSHALIRRFSMINGWQKRAHEYDLWREAEKTRIWQEELHKAEEKRLEREVARRELVWDLASKIQRRLMVKLERVLTGEEELDIDARSLAALADTIEKLTRSAVLLADGKSAPAIEEGAEHTKIAGAFKLYGDESMSEAKPTAPVHKGKLCSCGTWNSENGEYCWRCNTDITSIPAIEPLEATQ